jgi:hypothetical protein
VLLSLFNRIGLVRKPLPTFRSDALRRRFDRRLIAFALATTWSISLGKNPAQILGRICVGYPIEELSEANLLTAGQRVLETVQA